MIQRNRVTHRLSLSPVVRLVPRDRFYPVALSDPTLFQTNESEAHPDPKQADSVPYWDSEPKPWPVHWPTP